MINSSDILQSKILIVDDQAANILLLERMLRGAGYASVTSTMDPTEVTALHSKNRYDLILLDLEMPGEAYSGFQVMAELKEIEAEHFLPVIVITAHPDHKVHALEAGARDFISKPFELKETLARIHNMLEARLLHVAAKSRIKALEYELRKVAAGNDLLRRECAETQRK
jgi:adenylate cyclase